jgi:hypothetical protein
MVDLVPLTAYQTAPLFHRGRLGAVAGVFFGLVISATFALLERCSPSPCDPGASALVAGTLGGACFGWLFPRTVNAKLRKLTTRVFEGSGRYAAPAPTADLSHRLPSSLVVSRALAIGGVLYVGPEQLLFVPHSANLPRHRALRLIPRHALTVGVRPASLAGVQSFFFPNAPERLVLSDGTLSWEFVVPTPTSVCDALQQILK